MADPKPKRRRRRGGRKRSTYTAGRPTHSRNSAARGRSSSSIRSRASRSAAENSSTGARSVGRDQLPERLIYGINPVAVALSQDQLKTLFFDQGRLNERTQHLHAEANAQGLEIKPLQKQGWSKVLASELHQGVAGMLHDTPRHYLEEIVPEAAADSCILVLDRIQDPQNLGAVLRSAVACGVDAVVLPKAGGCSLTPAVHKASAGLSLKARVVEDENLAQAIAFLKEHGYWAIGCDSAAGEDATTFEFPERRVIVMGNESEGMRRLIKESCDYLVRIPMAEGVESLNVSVATAVVLYLAKADLARAAWEENNDTPAVPLENS